MFGSRVRELRQAKGLTQAALAARSGVSRQMIGAVERGQHLPRVDAAVALATALEVAVEALQSPPLRPFPDPIVGTRPPSGTPVRAARVGDRMVYAPVGGRSLDGWAATDGVIDDAGVALLDEARPGGVVVVGCDPAIGLAARLVAARSHDPVLAVAASTADAVAALVDGRTHACVVHGPEAQQPDPPIEVARWHLSRWQVGLAAPGDAPRGWAERALRGEGRVIQRRAGAGTQAAFERAVVGRGGTPPAGPVVEGHVEAAWLAAHMGIPAVTIEPAAVAAGLDFHPLEVHAAQLWVAASWADESGVRRLAEAFASAAFRHRLAAVGGYDLAGAGVRAG